MLTILIITYICGVFVSAFIFSMLSILTTPYLSILLGLTCIILWPIIWGLTMVGVTLTMVVYGGWVVTKRISRVFRMRSE